MGNKYKVVEITLKTRNGCWITKNTLILVAINKIELNYSEPYISSHYVSFFSLSEEYENIQDFIVVYQSIEYIFHISWSE